MMDLLLTFQLVQRQSLTIRPQSKEVAAVTAAAAAHLEAAEEQIKKLAFPSICAEACCCRRYMAN
jgi:hypothetical protein